MDEDIEIIFMNIEQESLFHYRLYTLNEALPIILNDLSKLLSPFFKLLLAICRFRPEGG